MNEHHRTAIKHHCRFAFETMGTRFRFIDAEARASVILTVNSGWE